MASGPVDKTSSLVSREVALQPHPRERTFSHIKECCYGNFLKEVDTGVCTWKWGDKDIPEVVSYCYLATEFANNGSWIVMYRR